VCSVAEIFAQRLRICMRQRREVIADLIAVITCGDHCETALLKITARCRNIGAASFTS
jgi:hypothetical protein